VAARFPDGQVYLNLGACAEQAPLRPTEAIGRLLGALGVPAADLPTDQEGAAALLRTTLAGRRVIVVLDDVLDTGQIQELLPATPGCAVILAGRPATTAVDGSGLLAPTGWTPTPTRRPRSPGSASTCRSRCASQPPGSPSVPSGRSGTSPPGWPTRSGGWTH